MVREVILPQLSMGMSEGSIAEWLVEDGAEVKRDQVIALIETEKVTTELTAPYAGFLHRMVAAGEAKIPVDTCIARLTDTHAEYAALAGGGDAAQPGAVPHAASLAASLAANPAAFVAAQNARIRVSGAAKALAAKHGIDLATLQGSGPGGRIVLEDVQAQIAQTTSAPEPTPVPKASAQTADVPAPPFASVPAPATAAAEKARIPMTGTRKVIAERMVAASTQAAQTFIFADVDASDLSAWHQRLRARAEALGSKISLTAIYAKALAVACRRVPVCNATVEGDAVVLWEAINVGIAVAVPGRSALESNLVVPVIRDVADKGIVQINEDIQQLVARARAGKLTPADTHGATVTLSSTAGFAAPGVWMVSTPLLNLPQVINFQPGTLVQKPMVVDGAVVARTVLPVSLTFDHRAMDGTLAAQCLRTICEFLQEPQAMLL